MSELFAVTPTVPGYPCAFSPDRRYRYALWRHWGGSAQPRYLMVIGLNPSTADETQDDPTIRRCIGFAKDWGYDALCMTNLFAFRATDPAVMKDEPAPIGEPLSFGGLDHNSLWLWTLSHAPQCGMILAAWGVHGEHQGRADEVINALTLWSPLGYKLHALGTTKEGHPRHPLYMPKSAVPEPYTPSPRP